jgi:hypothetical protein
MFEFDAAVPAEVVHVRHAGHVRARDRVVGQRVAVGAHGVEDPTPGGTGGRDGGGQSAERQQERRHDEQTDAGDRHRFPPRDETAGTARRRTVPISGIDRAGARS